MVDVVAGPTTGGIILAFETARQLGVRSIFAEEVHDADGATHREFRRGFHIDPTSACCSSTTSSRPVARSWR